MKKYLCKRCRLPINNRIDIRLHIQSHLNSMDIIDLIEEYYEPQREDKK